MDRRVRLLFNRIEGIPKEYCGSNEKYKMHCKQEQWLNSTNYHEINIVHANYFGLFFTPQRSFCWKNKYRQRSLSEQ